MTLEQWHSNDRKDKINTRTCVKNLKKIKKTGNHENILLLLGLLKKTSTELLRRNGQMKRPTLGEGSLWWEGFEK